MRSYVRPRQELRMLVSRRRVFGEKKSLAREGCVGDGNTRDDDEIRKDEKGGGFQRENLMNGF